MALAARGLPLAISGSTTSARSDVKHVGSQAVSVRRRKPLAQEICNDRPLHQTHLHAQEKRFQDEKNAVRAEVPSAEQRNHVVIEVRCEPANEWLATIRPHNLEPLTNPIAELP